MNEQPKGSGIVLGRNVLSRMSWSRLLPLLLAVAACGGQVQSSEESGYNNSSFGGGIGSEVSPASGGTPANAGSSTTANTQGAGGTFSIAGHSSSGGTVGVRSTLGLRCNTSSDSWTLCDTGSGGTVSHAGYAASGANSCGTPSLNRYVVGSNYAGYVFAFISLSSKSGDDLMCDTYGAHALCLDGQIAGTENSPEGLSIVGAVGFNLQQSTAPDSPAYPLPGTVSSVTVVFTNTSGSELRLQINQGSTYYCFDISPWMIGDTTNSVTVNANQFLTSCWDGNGASWDGTGATGIQLVVPSDSGSINEATPFSACLNSVTINM